MSHKAPEKFFREGLSLVKFTKMFPDDETAEKWFVEQRWPDGVTCSCCGSKNVQERKTRKPQPYRCRDCRKDFSTKTGTLMEGSKLGFQVWITAIYLLATHLRGISSMKLHRELEVTQKTAWYLAQRIRETWADNAGPFVGPVEVDETYIGGKRKNMSNAKQRQLKHEAVNHSVSEFVNGMAHVNGLESMWSMFKRGFHGTFHHVSASHLHRYINEFAGRPQRPLLRHHRHNGAHGAGLRRQETALQEVGRLMPRPKLLDLFCCAGGAAVGYDPCGVLCHRR